MSMISKVKQYVKCPDNKYRMISNQYIKLIRYSDGKYDYILKDNITFKQNMDGKYVLKMLDGSIIYF